MTTTTQLVQGIALAPAGRRRVAMALAAMQDNNGCDFSATMGQIAAAAGLSTVQARKHVHGLLAEELLAATGNVHGGAPGAGSSYSFNLSLLEHLAACTPDLFAEPQGGATEGLDDAYRFIVNDAHFLAVLVGKPGARRVVFWRVDRRHENYGDVSLKVLLCDPRTRGGWHFHLTPHGNPDVPYEQVFGLSSDQGTDLATWAQNTALGRVESLVTA